MTTVTISTRLEQEQGLLENLVSSDGHSSPDDVLSESLWQHYTRLWKDHQLQKEFLHYHYQSLSKTHLVWFNIFLTFLLYPQLISQPSSLLHPDAIARMKIVEIVCTVCSFLLNWSFCLPFLFPTLKSSINHNNNNNLQNDKNLQSLQGFSIIFTTINLAFSLIRRVYTNRILETDFLPLVQLSYTNIYEKVHVLPMDSVLWLILVPITQISVTREYRISVLLPVFVLALFSMIFCTIYWSYSLYVIPIILAYAYCGGMILLDYLKQNLLLFFLHRQLLTKMLVQERNAEEMRRKEMRHMIANVAHDLKSPLSSFINGVDVMSNDLRSIGNLLPTVAPDVRECFASIESTINYIKNVNNFMLMTINRCLDSTKASSGLKLIPKYETISLQDTLKLPVECMTLVQQKIEIQLLPWNSSQICSHIMTDKQWLQENVLCLLSNAVKYSSDGMITLSVQLKPKESFGGMRMYSDKAWHESDQLAIYHRKGIEAERNTSMVQLRTKFKAQSNSFIQESWISNLFPLSNYRVLPELPVLSSHTASITTTRTTIQTVEPSDQTYDERPKLNADNSICTLPNAITSSELHLDDKDNYLVFCVEDMGIGMSDQARKELFNPFKQNQRLAGGTGLGLYSLSKRVDALKGYYGVEKRRDGKQGSLFWFAIPYKPDTETARIDRQDSAEEKCSLFEGKNLNSIDLVSSSIQREQLSRSRLSVSLEGSPRTIPLKLTENLNLKEPSTFPQSSVKSANPPNYMTFDRVNDGSYNILIADDTASVSKMMKRLLEKRGHRVTVMENGALAFNAVQRHTQAGVDSERLKIVDSERFDVILMDLQMPVMDGIEATKRIRAFEKEINSKYQRNFHQLIISVSGNSDDEIVEEAREAGVDAFLPKPFSYETFYSTTKSLFKQVEN